MAAISHHVSGYSAVVFVGFAGKAASAGISMWTLFALPTFIAMMVGCFVWAPRWARLKVLTPVEYLERRYNNAVRVVVALAGIGVKFIDLGIKLYAISIVVQVCTGWDLVPIIIGAGIVGLSAAYQIARRSSLSVLVLEKSRTLGAGSTGASSAICRHRYSQDEMVTLARDGILAYRNWFAQ